MIGQFRNKSDQVITVQIGSLSDGITINENSSIIKFGDEPVVIDYSIDESFQTIIKKTATINLVTKDYEGANLFSGNAREVPVIITDSSNNCLFSGYLTPTTYNQPYNNYWDEFTLEAVDYLGTIEYYNYNDSATKTDYDTNKTGAGIVSFLSILQGILPSGANIYYDQSKGLDSSSVHTVFSDLSIPEFIFYGEEFDDVWTQEDVLHEILQYLNLHIIQEGNDFYIFDWETVKPSASISDFLNQQGLVPGENFYIMDKEHYDLDRALENHRNEMLFLPELETGETATVYIMVTDANCGYSGARYVGVWSEAYFREVSGNRDEVRETRSVDNNNILGGINYYALYCPEPYSLYRFEGTGGQRWNVYETNLYEGTWRNLTTNTTSDYNNKFFLIDKDLFGGSDTSISIDSVYNQISLTCSVDEQDTLIENPLDKNNLKSLYRGKQKYLTEFIAEIDKDDHRDNACDALNAMVKGNSTTYDKAKAFDWYMQVMTNPLWKLHKPGGGYIEDLCEQDSDGVYINQWKIPKYLREHSCTPAIISTGSYEIQKGTITDNSPVSKIDMTNYLYISVNGNVDDTENGHAPSDTTLQNASPLIEYVGNSGGVFSPPDDETTNYLVFSGKILLQPIQYESSAFKEYDDYIPIGWADRNNNYDAIRTGWAPYSDYSGGWHYAHVPKYDGTSDIVKGNNMIKSDNQEIGRYYSRKFYSQERVNDDPETSHLSVPSLQPWTKDKSGKGYEYNYSCTGNGNNNNTDLYSKLPVLECELIIGNKRLVEYNIDEYGNSSFGWYTIGQEPTGSYVDDNGNTQTYTMTTFSLGVNPKIGDKIIGDEFNIQNTIDYTMNLDTEGTAIPITRDDALSGNVTFRILGTINTTWNDITRRHPTWFRHTKWSSNTRFILAHTENVIIKDFQCKIYSDNGLYVGYDDDNEIVYCSAESDAFIEKKDDIEFKISTQLTSAECVQMGVPATINLNSVVKSSDHLTFNSIYNAKTGETDKAEKHYIDQYYREYSTPKTLLDITLHDSGARFCDNYSWDKLGHDYFIYSKSQSLKNEISTLRIKEI